MTIWKFPVLVTDAQVVIMPRGAQFLTLQVQNEEPCLWAMVDPELPKEKRYLLTIGTGSNFPPVIDKYVGTYQLDGGALVFHVFESGPVPVNP